MTATQLAQASNLTNITLTNTTITAEQLETALINAGKDPSVIQTIKF
jgi:hypothetical protein